MENSVQKTRPSPLPSSSSSSSSHTTTPASSSSGVCTPHSSPPPSVAFSALAYSKMVMHGIKHTQDAVNGILLGRVIEEEEKEEEDSPQGEGKSKKEGKKKRRTFFCIDVIPLFHTYILPPMLNCAFEIVEEMCRDLNDRISQGSSITRASNDSSRSRSRSAASSRSSSSPGSTSSSSCSSSVSAGKKEEEEEEERREESSREKKSNVSRFRSKPESDREESAAAGSVLSIIGSYHHNLLLPSTPEELAVPSYLASTVARTIQSKIPQSILCMMQLRRLTGGGPGRGGKAGGGASKETGDNRFANPKSCACVYYCDNTSNSTGASSSWRAFDSQGDVAVTPTAQMISQSVIQDATYMSLKDMDDHLFDPSLSPLNASLLSGYEAFLERDFRELREVYGLKVSEDIYLKQLLGVL